MRFVRLARGRAGPAGARMIGALVTVAALSGVAGCADAVANSASVWVSVSPATVSAGAQTQVTASCGENVNEATVSSIAFGSRTLQPVGGVLATTATISPETAPGTYGVRLACKTGSQATTTLTVIGGTASPSAKVPGPNTGGGFLARNPEQGGNPDQAEQASAPADRTPLVWLGVGLGFLMAGALVAMRSKQKAAVRSRFGRDDGTAGRR
ncbi:MAG: hypothetical protein IRY85_08030 [Micromonosporaceae bacterium]|nr:hypothetical protein [Micromonosporaceae bacterium]